jgi:two-component system sensor histidine kinase SenX3
MTLGKRRVSAVTILVGVVMLLVPALAFMQYQWLGQLSTAERERMQRTLRTAAAQFATEFDSELSRTLVNLQVDGPTIRNENWGAYAQRYSAWANSVSEPRLVRDVFLVDTLPGTRLPDAISVERPAPIPPEQLRLRKWNTQSLAFEPAEWPDDLLRVRDSLVTRMIGLQYQGGRRQQDPDGHRDPSLSLTINDDNLLISPVTLFELPERPGPPKIQILGFTIVRLDPAVIRETVLAALTQRHFHGGDSEVDYRVAVIKKDQPGTVIWESEPGIAATVAAAPDVTQTFMGARTDQMFVFARNLREDVTETRTLAVPPPPPPPPGPGEARGGNVIVQMIEREKMRAGGPGGSRVITRAGNFGGTEGRWLLTAKHRSGSLEAAVSAVRMRNLIVSSSILMLLTVVIGLIAVSARRAQELARQQMEFVAAVSHELRTPVSVIGAAAGNLADGVVGDPQRVRKYGETIQGEARRLGETVERVLQLAGIAAGSSAAAQTPIAPADLVQESLSGCRPEIEAAGFNVEVAVADALPNVVGDVAALKSALQNVISNAVKYGGAARWIRVSASLEPPRSGLVQTVDRTRGYRVDLKRGYRRGRSVYFAIEDRGIGIDPNDRRHIFEPFYRGREAVAQQIQGSGLGLNLVMTIVAAHGGHVMVQSDPGKGSTFILAIPAASESESISLVREATSPR